MPWTKLSTNVIPTVICATLLSFAVCCNRNSNSSTDQPGTSVVVLVDFSKSFAVSKQQNGKMVYGLQAADRRALTSLAGAVAELTAGSWTPPLKAIWTQIQTASIRDKPLCAPLETVQKLVKPPGSVGTREEIDRVLSKCVADIVEASTDQTRLATYTDISGAVAIAADAASGAFSERILVIISDFQEDLPPGSHKATFNLKGERVVLLHRPGTDEPQNIDAYLTRIDSWRRKLLESGARTVVTMPVFAVSETRLRAALRLQDFQLGTDITLVADFKDELVSSLGSGPGEQGLLLQIGRTITDIARDWPPPVTTVWMSIGPSGFSSTTLPPVEFGPSLIKKEHALNTVEEFARATEELANALSKQSRATPHSDLSGSLALACSIQPTAQQQILIVISDFIDDGPKPAATFRLDHSRVVMIYAPSSSDRTDPNRFVERRQAWEQRFKESGAATVSEISLMSFTPNDLRSALSKSRKVSK